MREWLMDLLACPACRGRIELASGTLDEGTLRCVGCTKTFPVRDSVPELFVVPPARVDFAEQWKLRWTGRFEREGLIYGVDADRRARWIADACLGRPSSGEIVLDVGCGSGDTAASIARDYPEVKVVGLDMTPTLSRCQERFRDLKNLSFVRGSALKPPLRNQAFSRALSFGVLHHTGDTRGGLHAVGGLVAQGGRLAVCLYRHPDEAPSWRPYYWVRDKLHFGRGHKLPPKALFWLVRAEGLVAAPIMWALFQTSNAARATAPAEWDLPSLGLREIYDYMVFTLYDALSPEFQDRPATPDIEQWFADSGFGQVSHDIYGNHWADRAHAKP
ncbi:methyltransferase [Stigmatella hybrida]|uniref:methyltransferase n=1 Tax=Stigmatella hybrida TaxID=394097 RepID=UPI001CDB084C|nr:methyltransferase domain-containing protein [Stigmatella hybrida]